MQIEIGENVTNRAEINTNNRLAHRACAGLSLMLFSAVMLSGRVALGADTPLSGDGVTIEFFSGETDTFEKGAKLFSDRDPMSVPIWITPLLLYRSIPEPIRCYQPT